MAREAWETVNSQKVRLHEALGVEKGSGETEVAQV